ncbi:hypothetical protein M8J75_000456 [Diaphorina citri]|nr:hypothetical protein M8J75_000456 [Diaphorina citri]
MSSKKGTPSSTPTLFNFFKKIDPPQFPSPNASPKTPTSTTSKKTSPSSKTKQPLSDKKHSPNQQEDSPQGSTPHKRKIKLFNQEAECESNESISPEGAKENEKNKRNQKSPKSKDSKESPEKKGDSESSTPASSKGKKTSKSPAKSEDDSPVTKRPRRKSAKRVKSAIQSDSEPDDMLQDNGSEDEYVPPKAEVESESEHSSGEEELEESVEDPTPSSSEAEVTPIKNGNKRGLSSKSGQPTKKPKLTAPSTPSTPSFPVPDTSETTPSTSGAQDWSHNHYQFLHPDHILDADRRSPKHPDYNPKTLYVPPDFLKKQTPCMGQWWTIKSQNFDCVLFFKVGKFYELFHMDAVIGADELACSYMKNEYAHSGFPEISYGKFAQTLVEKGYKVARVEQTESAEQMDIRTKRDKVPQKQRVVRREICKITCRGAQTFSIMDVDANYVDNKFLLGVTKEGDRLGVCFIDTTIGEFHVGEFEDDKQFSRLSTLMSHYPPCRILLEKSLWSEHELRVFLNVVRINDIEFLSGKKDILSEDKVIAALTPQEHEAAKALISGELTGGSSNTSRLDLKCFGIIYGFLKRCLINEQLVTLGKFKRYIPVDQETSNSQSGEDSQYQYPKYMILDSTALANLHVLTNSDNTTEGTLIEQLDHCVTSFGKRMLRAQLVKPLTNLDAIKQRQDAISVLLDQKHITEQMRAKMKDLRDLERMLPRIYSLTSAAVPANHPESRATLYESKVYSKKKIEVFTNALKDLKAAKNIMEVLQESGCTGESTLLTQLCNYENQTPSGCFPDMSELLKYFENAFDHKEASSAGNIIPKVC